MSCCCCVGLVILAAISYLIFKWMKKNPYLDEKAPIPPDKWWASQSSEKGEDDTSLKEFNINVNEEKIEDLKNRLRNTRFHDQLDDATFEYGFQSNVLKQVVDYWLNTYDWQKQQEFLNSFPQFTTEIEGLKIHFLRVKPKDTENGMVKVQPILMVHGWPGSVLEFYKIIPLLTTSRNGMAFEVICPSIPGYGFSNSPQKKGFTAADTARIFTKLMTRLGHTKFYVQGGDWGSFIITLISTIYPKRVLGLHLNMVSNRKFMFTPKVILGAWIPFFFCSQDREKIYPIKQKFFALLRETGYLHIQATKPDTVGSALNDSPAGLAAYILEKFSTWTNDSNVKSSDGKLLEKFTLDELLTNVMIYWINENITSSMRYYKENFSENITKYKFDNYMIVVPTAYACFPHEMVKVPECFLKQKFPKLVQYSDMAAGGHFAAMEEPNLLAEDIWKFAKTVENGARFS